MHSPYKGRIKNFDKITLILVCLLSVCGLLAIYSATYSYGSLSNVITQGVSFLLGLALMIALTFFDYEQYEGMVKYIGAVAIFLLILVLFVGKGSGDWGAKSWIRICSFGIQPSERAKIAFIITFSYHLSLVRDDINKPLTLLKLILHAAVPIGLILLQPDAGSAMVFIFIFLVMIFTAGLSYKYIIPAGVLGIASLPVIYSCLNEFQKARIRVFFNPESDPLYRGYNVIQSKIAVGSGRLFGCGFLKGSQTQLEFLPTKHTDFIFSVICEESGLIGAGIIILMLTLLILRCIKTAKNANTPFGKYIAVGVSAMFIFHTFENCGMCIGLTPVTGIPLPFISYGGTSLLSYMIAVGLVMSVAYRSKK